ncbi:MAG: hypothetical protein PHG48_01215, partial [Eubacteriales bacterium]|nr:hypothetical protein [Eubacteriales bacterium]
MLKNLKEIIEGNESNYLLPFYWQHGNHRERIPAQIERIFDSGARAFCVESRPHKDFCGDGWWQDMDIIMDEASKRGMKVWVLDDDHFPTGHANGLIVSGYPELRKWQLAEKHVDVVGPMKGASLLLPLIDEENESLIGVYVYRRDCYEELLSDAPLTLTNNVSGSFLYWDIPSGIYRIFFLYKTRKGTNRPDYINMLDPASVDVLIEAVYEPHYRHYGKYFGNVFAGFFSDEPNLGNTMYGSGQAGSNIYDKKMGMPGLALPWSDAITEMMEETLGYSAKGCLPILWYDHDDKACRSGSASADGSYLPSGRGTAGTDPDTFVTGDMRTAKIRYAYMDAVTRLYRDSFTKRVGGWCRSHGVLYIGHIIEDMNSHARLGYSAGHYFRSLDGQDMSGMDIVLHQVLPGFTNLKHTSIAFGGMVDPEFNHYVLAKLCSSMSHIYPLTKGRAMCEVFGAYGWAAGIPMMKWLIDFLLVRGVNYFVPHAFSPKYPDPDCPPHFGAEGHDPQFKGFSVLMKYTNKMSHLFEGTLHRADAALLYHAEAEWMTGDDCMLTQKPAKKLYDDHIDYDIIPADAFTRAEDPAKVRDGKLCIGREQYNCLVVPYSKYLPDGLTEALAKLQDRGLSIY